MAVTIGNPRRLERLTSVAVIACVSCGGGPLEPSEIPGNPHNYGHRMACSGPFFATDNRYGVFDTPGTCEVVADGSDASRRRARRPVIADAEDLLGTGRQSYTTVEPGALLAVWISCCDPARVRRGLAAAEARGVPALIYWDDQVLDPQVRTWLRPGDIVGVQAYPSVTAPDLARDLATIEASVALASSWGSRVALIRPLYTSDQRWPLELVLRIQVPLTDLIRKHPHVEYDLWFSWGRSDGGGSDLDELQQHARWLDAAAR